MSIEIELWNIFTYCKYVGTTIYLRAHDGSCLLTDAAPRVSSDTLYGNPLDPEHMNVRHYP